MPDFNTALKKKFVDVEKPKEVPPGTYTVMVTKIPDTEDSADGKWTFLTFPMRLVAAGEDVDQDALREYGGLGPMANLRLRFIFDKSDADEAQAAFDRTLYNVKRLLIDHLKCSSPDQELKEGLNNSINQQCLAVVKWRADKTDPSILRAEINRTAPIEA
jgi:hypothetical protein